VPDITLETAECASCHALWPPDPTHYDPAAHEAAPFNVSCPDCHFMDLSDEHDKSTSELIGGGAISCVDCHTLKVEGLAAPWDGDCFACHVYADWHDDSPIVHQSPSGQCGGVDCHPITDVTAIHAGLPGVGCPACHEDQATVPATTDCEDCHTPHDLLFSDGFESGGLSAWDRSSYWTITDTEHSGVYGARMTRSGRDAYLEKDVDTTGKTDLTLTFWLKGNTQTESADHVTVSFRDDTGAWHTVWTKTLEDRDFRWAEQTVAIPEGTYGPFGSGAAFRILARVSSSNEYQYVDDVGLSGF
jgi:hypothetical protein